MIKVLFLEYKFGDFTDDELLLPNASGVFASFEKLNKKRINQIKRLGLSFGISLTLASRQGCIANPSIQKKLSNQLQSAIELGPNMLWLDQLRFPGVWETKDKKINYKVHSECLYCEGKDRIEIVTDLAKKLKKRIPISIKSGYFAVPYKKGDKDNWQAKIGQDHKRLNSIFEYVSPMLYYRMLNYPLSYIGEHIKYLGKIVKKGRVLPAIQIKDMPDNVVDKLTVKEIEEEIHQALSPLSIGLVLFSWDHAKEKGKLKAVSEILREV